jgi:hypothetical protein
LLIRRGYQLVDSLNEEATEESEMFSLG